jgi:hypothetical protein
MAGVVMPAATIRYLLLMLAATCFVVVGILQQDYTATTAGFLAAILAEIGEGDNATK